MSDSTLVMHELESLRAQVSALLSDQAMAGSTKANDTASINAVKERMATIERGMAGLQAQLADTSAAARKHAQGQINATGKTILTAVGETLGTALGETRKELREEMTHTVAQTHGEVMKAAAAASAMSVASADVLSALAYRFAHGQE